MAAYTPAVPDTGPELMRAHAVSVMRYEIGARKNRVIVVDNAIADADACVDIAASLAPFNAEAGTFYPGLRRLITQADSEAQGYVETLLAIASPLLREAFGAETIELTEASFSMVTRRPDQLKPSQRIPHYDSVEPGYVAILHYLTDIADTGTCFYRHRATGFDRVSRHTLPTYSSVLAFEGSAEAGGFIGDSNDRFERLLRVDGHFNRLLIYESALLHSGFIPDDFAFSDNPRTGRLTGNLFVRIR